MRKRQTSRAMATNLIAVTLAALALQVISAQGIFENAEPMPPVRPLPWAHKDSISSAIGEPEPHIVGGFEAVPHDYPHQAAVRIEEDGKQYLCGGSLISTSWVLTAAHCVDGSSRILVVLGAHNIRKNETNTQVIEADKIIIHPHWPDQRTDIALLRLQSNATLDGKYIDIIQLPSFLQRRRTFFWHEAVMTGWGRTTDDNRELSPVLRTVKTWIVSNYYCSYRYYFLLPSSEICASGYRAKGTCNGDSGGPLHIVEPDGSRTLVGITSWGHPQCELSWPPVFTRVTSYLDWIYETTDIASR